MLRYVLGPSFVSTLLRRLGATSFLDEILPFLLDSLRSDDELLCEQSKFSTLMLWYVTHLLGSVLNGGHS